MSNANKLLRRFLDLIATENNPAAYEPCYFLWRKILQFMAPYLQPDELKIFFQTCLEVRNRMACDEEARRMVLQLPLKNATQDLLALFSLLDEDQAHTWGTTPITTELWHDGGGLFSDVILLSSWLAFLAQNLPSTLNIMSSSAIRQKFNALNGIVGRRFIVLMQEFLNVQIRLNLLKYIVQFYGWFCDALNPETEGETILVVLDHMTAAVEVCFNRPTDVDASPRYSMKVLRAREQLKSCLESGEGNNVLRHIDSYCNTIVGLFKNIAEEIVTILGHPPIAFEVIAVGSWALEQAVPNSDLEYFIVLSGPLPSHSVSYFKSFIELFNMAINSTKFIHVDGHFKPTITKDGFLFAGDIPWYMKELAVDSQKFNPKSPFNNELFSFLSTKSIYQSHNNFNGLQQFRTAIQGLLNASYEKIKKYAFRKIEHDIAARKHFTRFDYQFNTYFILVLALLDGIDVVHASVLEVLQSLLKKDRITDDTVKKFHEVHTAQRISIARHHLELEHDKIVLNNNSDMTKICQRLVLFVQSHEGNEAIYHQLFLSLWRLQRCRDAEEMEPHNDKAIASLELSRILLGCLPCNSPLEVKDYQSLAHVIENSLSVPFCSDAQFALQLMLSLLLNAEVVPEIVAVNNNEVHVLEISTPLSFKRRARNVLLLLPEMQKAVPNEFVLFLKSLNVCNLFDSLIRSAENRQYLFSSAALKKMFWAVASLKDFFGRTTNDDHNHWSIVAIIYQVYQFDQSLVFASHQSLKDRLVEMREEIVAINEDCEQNEEDLSVLKTTLVDLTSCYKARYGCQILPKPCPSDLLAHAIWTEYGRLLPDLTGALKNSPVESFSFGPVPVKQLISTDIPSNYIANVLRQLKSSLKVLRLPDMPLRNSCMTAIARCRNLLRITGSFTQEQLQTILQLPHLSTVELYSYQSISNDFLVRHLRSKSVKFIGLPRRRKADICNYLLYMTDSTSFNNKAIVRSNIEHLLPDIHDGVLDLSLYHLREISMYAKVKDATRIIFGRQPCHQDLLQLCLDSQGIEIVTPNVDEDLAIGYTSYTNDQLSTKEQFVLPNGEVVRIDQSALLFGGAAVTNDDNCTLVKKVLLLPNCLLAILFASKSKSDEFQFKFYNWEKKSFVHQNPVTEYEVHDVQALEGSILISYRSGRVARLNVDRKESTMWICAQNLIAVSPDRKRFATYSPWEKLYKIFSSETGHSLYETVVLDENQLHEGKQNVFAVSGKFNGEIAIKELKQSLIESTEFLASSMNPAKLEDLKKIVNIQFRTAPDPLTNHCPHFFLHNPDMIAPTISAIEIIDPKKFLVGMTNGDILLVFSNDGTLQVIQQVKCCEDAIDQFAILHGESLKVVVTSRTGQVTLWDVASKTLIKSKTYQFPIETRVMAQWIKSGGSDKILISPLNGQRKQPIILDMKLTEVGKLTMLPLTPADTYITHLISFGEKLMYCTRRAIYDRSNKTGTNTTKVELQRPVSSFALLKYAENGTPSFAFVEDSNKIVFADLNRSVVETAHAQPISCMVRFDSERVITGSLCGRICLSNNEDSTILYDVQKPIADLKIWMNTLAVRTLDGMLIVLDISNLEHIVLYAYSSFNEYDVVIDQIRRKDDQYKMKIVTQTIEARNALISFLSKCGIIIENSQSISELPLDESPAQAQTQIQIQPKSFLRRFIDCMMPRKPNDNAQSETWINNVVIPKDRL